MGLTWDDTEDTPLTMLCKSRSACCEDLEETSKRGCWAVEAACWGCCLCPLWGSEVFLRIMTLLRCPVSSSVEWWSGGLEAEAGGAADPPLLDELIWCKAKPSSGFAVASIILCMIHGSKLERKDGQNTAFYCLLHKNSASKAQLALKLDKATLSSRK